jgi:hypothetical protein
MSWILLFVFGPIVLAFVIWVISLICGGILYVVSPSARDEIRTGVTPEQRKADAEFLMSPLALRWQREAREQAERERAGRSVPGEPSFRDFDAWLDFRSASNA